MLHYLCRLSDWYGPLRVFESITFRTVTAMAVSFALVLFLGPRFIAYMLRRRATEDVEKPDSATLNRLHAGKKNTPTMGGLVILAAVMSTVFLFGHPANPWIWMGQGVLLGFGALGFVDDYMKLKGLGKQGLVKRQKLAGQVLLAALTTLALAWGGWFRLVDAPPLAQDSDAARLLAWIGGTSDGDAFSAAAPRPALDAGMPAFDPRPPAGARNAEGVAGGLPPTHLVIPFTKWSDVRPDLGWAFWLFAILVLVACSNAVNLADGLDGLAAGCSLTVMLTFLAFTYVAGNEVLCAFFRIPHVAYCGELAVYAAALTGGLLGFLWFNAHPARMFMGDTGSLPLGAAAALLAVATKHELVLVLAAGVFVLEAASVVVQVGSFKLTGRRVFRCAPFHHHLEFGGWHENQVVVRFWIAGAILAALALGTLKMH